MPRSQRLKSYAFIQDLVDAGETVLMDGIELTAEQQLGLGAGAPLRLQASQARQLMLELARRFCHRNAKSIVYIPEAGWLDKLDRNARIWHEYQQDTATARKFTAQRLHELAAEYDLTPQQIYTIIARERRHEVSEVQAELPGIPPAD